MVVFFIAVMGILTAEILVTGPLFRIYILAPLVTIREFNNISSKILPRMSINTFLKIMFPDNRAELCFEFEKEEIVVLNHFVKQFNFELVGGVSRRTIFPIITVFRI